MRCGKLKNKVDAAIITIRSDEYDAVESRMGATVEVTDGNNEYRHAFLPLKDGRRLSVVLTRCSGGQGNGKAQAVATNIIYDLNPKWLILTGIAGGTPDHEFCLGDVIIASALHDFSFGSVSENGDITWQAGGGPMHQDVERFLQTGIGAAAQKTLRDLIPEDDRRVLSNPPDLYDAGMDEQTSLYGPNDFKRKVQEVIRKRFPDEKKRNRDFRLYSGACMNGNVVLKNAELLIKWQEFSRQAGHEETELAGVYEAARTAGNENYPVLAVRGLSDIVGLKRNREWTQYACNAAAAVTISILKSGSLRRRRRLSGTIKRAVVYAGLLVLPAGGAFLFSKMFKPEPAPVSGSNPHSEHAPGSAAHTTQWLSGTTWSSWWPGGRMEFQFDPSGTITGVPQWKGTRWHVADGNKFTWIAPNGMPATFTLSDDLKSFHGEGWDNTFMQGKMISVK